MAAFVDFLRKRHHGQTVVAVSHADPIMILRTGTLGRPLVIDSLQGKYYPLKGSITEFSYCAESSRPIVVYRTPAEGSAPVTESSDEAREGTVRASENGHVRARSPWIPSSESTR
jgi:broad specificity phosphatase PhoE